MRKSVLFFFLTIAALACRAQNIGINTDGTSGETGVMLDVKGINSLATNGSENIFQIKSFDASATALKLRLALGTGATLYGAIEVYDASAALNRTLALQPSGGNIAIGQTSAAQALDINGSMQLTGGGRTLYFGQAAEAGPFGLDFSGEIGLKYKTGTNNLIFEHSDASAILSVDRDDKRVGVGIANPLEEFHVVGDVRVSSLDAGGAGALKLVQADENGTLSLSTVSSAYFCPGAVLTIGASLSSTGSGNVVNLVNVASGCGVLKGIYWRINAGAREADISITIDGNATPTFIFPETGSDYFSFVSNRAADGFDYGYFPLDIPYSSSLVITIKGRAAVWQTGKFRVIYTTL